MTDSLARPRAPTFLPWLMVGYALAALLATDLYLPSMPMLPGEFGTTDRMVQLTMTVYLGGFAAAQLIYGPLSDRFGRRPVLLGGGVAFVAATLVCTLAPDIWTFIAARFAQGAAVSSLTVTSRATMRELYDDTRFTKLSAMVAMAEAMAPALGPIIGAEILAQLGWRWNFYLVAGAAGLALFGLWATLPETNLRPNRRALRLANLAITYTRILLRPSFTGPVLAISLVFGALMAYLTTAPFLLIDSLGLTPRQFSYVQVGMVAAYVLGLGTTGRMVERIGPNLLIAGAFAATGLGSAGALVLALCGVAEVPAVAVPFAIFAFGIGLGTTPLMAKALSVDRGATGAVAAMLGAILMGCAFLGSLIARSAYDGSVLSLALPMAGLTGAGLAVYLMLGLPRR